MSKQPKGYYQVIAFTDSERERHNATSFVFLDENERNIFLRYCLAKGIEFETHDYPYKLSLTAAETIKDYEFFHSSRFASKGGA